MDPDRIDIRANMFQEGYIDSLALYRIVNEIENEFNVEFGENDIADRRITTVEGLCAMISERQYSVNDAD